MSTDPSDFPWTINVDLLENSGFEADPKVVDIVIARYLMSGDARPFCWWVEHGHQPSSAVIQVLAHVLNENTTPNDDFPYQFKAKLRVPKRGRPKKGPEEKLRDILIALCIDKLMHEYGNGSYDAAVEEVAGWACVSVALAKKAYDKFSGVISSFEEE